MAASVRLSDEDIRGFLRDLPGWELSNNQLHRSFRFPNFSVALGFMVRVGLAAEAMDHHPNWYNVYGNVDVQLWTHDASGVTALDIRLAKTMHDYAVGIEVRPSAGGTSAPE